MNHSHPNKSDLPIREAIKRQFEAETLDSNQLQRLMTLQERVLEGSGDAQRTLRQISGYRPIAACALLLLAITFLWYPGAERHDTTHQIALEVASNHLKLKPLDITAHSMNEVRGFFTQLDFSPVNSELLPGYFALPERAMLGGRYCSIKGITAAQLRYRRADNGISTLYEVAYDPDIYGPIPSLESGEPPEEIIIKGLRVSLWLEKGLMMVLVQDS
jgi:hypothetical protein